MKLKWITAVVILVFLVVLSYFFINGYILYHAPVPDSKPSPAVIRGKIKAAKEGLYDPSAPPIVH
jgi:hypothetical protein